MDSTLPCGPGSDVARALCVPRSHLCERPELIKTVFARVRTRHAKCVRYENVLFLFRILLAASLASTLGAQTDWPVYGHDPGGMRYSPLKQINTANVSTLHRIWTYHTGELLEPKAADAPRAVAFETTPLVIGNTLYFSTPANRVIALDPETGRKIWAFDPQAKWHGEPSSRAHRGVAYWPGDQQRRRESCLVRSTAG